MEFDSIDDEYNGIGSVDISEIFEMQGSFFFWMI